MPAPMLEHYYLPNEMEQPVAQNHDLQLRVGSGQMPSRKNYKNFKEPYMRKPRKKIKTVGSLNSQKDLDLSNQLNLSLSSTPNLNEAEAGWSSKYLITKLITKKLSGDKKNKLRQHSEQNEDLTYSDHIQRVLGNYEKN